MAEEYESMTRVVTESELVARVWCAEQTETNYDTRHNAVTELIRANAASRETLATAIRTIDAWSAYEIIDKFGNGRVVYREWP